MRVAAIGGKAIRILDTVRVTGTEEGAGERLPHARSIAAAMRLQHTTRLPKDRFVALVARSPGRS
jgi:hypothetical protein